MKIPEFDVSRVTWDGWKRWTNAHPKSLAYRPLFVTFSTGEAVFTTSSVDPDARRDYPEWGFSIYATNDSKCPRFEMPTGEEVKLAWLDDCGQQTFLIDHDSKRAVRLDPARPNGRGTSTVYERSGQFVYVPADLAERVTAYIAGPKAPPIGHCPVVVKPTVLSPEQRDHIAGLKAACLSWTKLAEEEVVKLAKREVQRRPYLINGRALLSKTFDELLPVERVRLVERGMTPILTRTKVNYLIAKI